MRTIKLHVSISYFIIVIWLQSEIRLAAILQLFFFPWHVILQLEYNNWLAAHCACTGSEQWRMQNTMPCLRLCLLDLTAMSGKIITWFCKLMKTSPSTPPIESFTGMSRNNQVSRLPSYYLLEPPL